MEDGGEESMLIIPGAGVVVEQVEEIAAGLIGNELQLEIRFKEIMIWILMRKHLLEKEKEGRVASSQLSKILMRTIVNSEIAYLWQSARNPIHHQRFGADIEGTLGRVIAVASLERGWSGIGW